MFDLRPNANIKCTSGIKLEGPEKFGTLKKMVQLCLCKYDLDHRQLCNCQNLVVVDIHKPYGN